MREILSTRKHRWRWAGQLSLLVWLFSISVAAQNYEGQWNRTYLQFSVNVEHWGEHCGVRPRSYSSRAQKQTEILQNKGHLFFSTGGLRTDRCNSPNPSLNTLTTSRSANMWTRTCETPSGSSKYEKIDYTFSGTDDKLTYVAESSFRWSLNGDLCVVRWVERRTYQRAVSEEGSSGGSPIVRIHKNDNFSKKSRESAANSVCNTPGKAKRLILAPLKARVSPSQSLCYQLKGVDGNGCRFPVSASWSVAQNGVSQNHLMTDHGCFKAGDNAAESEGVFEITARYRGLHVSASLEVAYPDIGDLARARLDIARELDASETDSDGERSAGQNGRTGVAGGFSADTVANGALNGDSRPSWMMWALGGAALVFVVLVTILIVVLVHRGYGGSPSSPGGASPVPPTAAQKAQPNASPFREDPAAHSPASVGMVCPRCGASYPPDARFCPLDAAELTAADPFGAAVFHNSFPPPKGMICPKCKRGYEMGAKFCPHDSTSLVEYARWRSEMGEKQ